MGPDSNGAETDIIDLISMDHQRAKTLIGNIQNSHRAADVQSLFDQLHQALTIHLAAKEAVVYPAMQSFHQEDAQELRDDQEEIESMLSELKSMEPLSDEFSMMLRELRSVIGEHSRQEESTLFASIRKNLSASQRQDLAQQFKNSKQTLQRQM
jgi:hemerythrin superfamily protein